MTYIKLLVLVGFDLHFPLISGIYKLHQIKASFHTFQLLPLFIPFTIVVHFTLTTKICKKTEFILSKLKNSFTLREKDVTFLNLYKSYSGTLQNFEKILSLFIF